MEENIPAKMIKQHFFYEEHSRRQYEEITKDAIKKYKEDRRPELKRRF
jgi:hypothetical protein